MLTTTHIISVEKFLIAVFVGARVPKLSVRIMNKRVYYSPIYPPIYPLPMLIQSSQSPVYQSD